MSKSQNELILEKFKETPQGKEILQQIKIETEERPKAGERRRALIEALNKFRAENESRIPEAENMVEEAKEALENAKRKKALIFSEIFNEIDRLERAVAKEEAFLLSSAPQRLKYEEQRLLQEIRTLPKFVRRYAREEDIPKRPERKVVTSNDLVERELERYEDDGVILREAEKRMNKDIEKLQRELDVVKDQILSGVN